jgi:putative inorganic carbon (HCO3(-)) transporter
MATVTHDHRAGEPPLAGLLAVALAGGAAVALAWQAVGSLPDSQRPLAIVAPVGLGALALAVTRFDWFVLVALVVRSSLDVFDAGWGGGGTDPAAALSLLLVLTGGLWLLAQRAEGTLEPPSVATIGLWTLAGAALVSVLVAVNRGPAVEWNLRLLAGVMMFTVVEQLVRRRPAFAGQLVAAVVASLVVPLLVATVQALGSAPTVGGIARVEGTFAHPNPFATYLAMALLLLVALCVVARGASRWAAVVAIAWTAWILLETQARGAWLAALIGLVLLGIGLERRILVFLVVGVGAAVALVPSTLDRLGDLSEEKYTGTDPANSLEWRIGYWERLVASNSTAGRISGIGLEQVQRTSPEALQPHNVFVQTYVELGVFGVAALVAVVVGFGLWLRHRLAVSATPFERATAWAAVAIAVSLLTQFGSENLLTNTAAHWYAAGAMTFGALRARAHPTARSTVRAHRAGLVTASPGYVTSTDGRTLHGSGRTA